MNAERSRLDDTRRRQVPWKKWGPYLSERQWGTVREDYSENGNAWDHFSHDQARSRAYRWGEDGLAGISDDRQQLCFALALWNGKDPLLKERLFGLTNREANHGEDVKEYYFYLDSTPTHSYMKYLYKYPQEAYPYDTLVSMNQRRSRQETEYELLDTGVFDDNRYFDVFVEYAKASPEDVLVQITAWNRGPDIAALHVLPTVWFRNVWSWGNDVIRPALHEKGNGGIALHHFPLGERLFHAEDPEDLLFTENETNGARLFGTANATPYVKDAFHEYIVHGRHDAVNPERRGTKAAAHYRLSIPGGASQTIRLRLRDAAPATTPLATPLTDGSPFSGFDAVMSARRQEADEFYRTIIPTTLTSDQTNVIRQALAGMLWGKQFYYYDVDKWLDERAPGPFKARRDAPRNARWQHLHSADIVSMPDKWEYPWYAAWDLAFHAVALTLVDEDFGKQQLDLMLRERYLHPNGQLPAYEWNFGDVTPPVHAWSTIITYRLEEAQRGVGDVEWLEQSFQKLLLNFTWWVNRKDRTGKNVFEDGLLSLDNIGVFDHRAPLPTGGSLEQAAGTAWMALFCQNMLEISATLADARPSYLPMCRKFAEHFLWIASSMVHTAGEVGMWDEEDGFFYDVLRAPDGAAMRLKVRSMIGLLPLCAATSFRSINVWKDPEVLRGLQKFLTARPELRLQIHDPVESGYAGRKLTSILNRARLQRVLAIMLDENEFLSPYGIRALSRYHKDHPCVFRLGETDYRVEYLPGESDIDLFGGNANWRGPVWMPFNALIIRALLQYYSYFGDEFTIECPTGSGRTMTLYQIAAELTRRLSSIFLRNAEGRRPLYGETAKFQNDPHWRNLILFYEYFHGDTGAGLGASHQTGWTGIVVRLLHLFATYSPAAFLEFGTPKGLTHALAS